MHLVNYGQSLKNVLLEKHTNSLKETFSKGAVADWAGLES